MAKDYLIGVDIGTQATKSVLVSLEGEILGTASQEHRVEQPQPSWAEQWPQVWEDAVYQTIHATLQQAGIPPGKVAGVCLSGLYGGSGVPVGRDFQPLRPCIIWMDRRTTDEVRWVREHLDLDELFATTGNWVDTYFGYTKILWIKHHEPLIWKRIHRFLPPTSYVEFKLTGRLAIDYSSAGNLGGLFDVHALQWSERLSHELGIPLEMMPDELIPSTEVVGQLTSEAARETGLLPGTPVIAGGIDAPVATLSAGAIERGDNVAMMGTSTCWGVVHRGEAYSKSLVSMPHVVNCTEEIYTWGGAATSGGLVRWFRDQFGEPEVEEAEKRGGDPYQLLDARAAEIPAGSDGLVVLPYFMGERAPLWDPDARGTILGLTLYHTKPHLFRALLEAAAYSLRHGIEAGEKIGLHLKAETRIVGGVAKSPLWTKILADVTGRKLLIPAGGVGAPLGDALLAGIGVGLIPDYRIIAQWTSIDRVDTPDPVTREVYDSYYALYRAFYEDIKDHIHELSVIGGARDEKRD
jgi:sugar (pentulose or hexulose) kinase